MDDLPMDDDDSLHQDSPEVDKRLMMMRNLRKEIMNSDADDKEASQNAKMDELNLRI